MIDILEILFASRNIRSKLKISKIVLLFLLKDNEKLLLVTLKKKLDMNYYLLYKNSIIIKLVS